MELIDEDGRLFGVVNVIDALAVLLVLAVVVAGFALVNPFAAPSGEQTTRYATIDLDDQPAYVADLVSEGDVMSPPNTPRNVTITDVYVTPDGGENVSITVRARINGTLEDREGAPGQAFTYGDTRIRQGGSFMLDTADYRVDGTVTRMDDDGRTLETGRTNVTLTAEMSRATAGAIEAGQTVSVADREVARITEVHVLPGNETTTRLVYLGVELETLRRSDGPSFGGELLALDRSIPINTGSYQLTGRVYALGTDRVQTETRSVTLGTTVDEDTSERLDVGDTYRIADRSVAEITALQRFPGSTPDQHRVVLGLQLETVLAESDRFFGRNRIAIGQSIPFRTDVYSLSGTIRTIGDGDLDRESAQAVIETTVPKRVANELSEGDEYRLAGTTVATVRSIDTYPGGGQEQTRVNLGLELTTVRRGGDQFFGASPLRIGATIPFETDAYRLSGTVIGRNSLTPPGETTTKTIVVKVANVHPEIADGIRTGMTEETSGRTTARLVDKRTEPADVILTSEDGEIFERQHPRNQDVYLTVEVTVRSTRTGLRFHSQTIQEGDTVTLDFGTISVDGTIIEIR